MSSRINSPFSQSPSSTLRLTFSRGLSEVGSNPTDTSTTPPPNSDNPHRYYVDMITKTVYLILGNIAQGGRKKTELVRAVRIDSSPNSASPFDLLEFLSESYLYSNPDPIYSETDALPGNLSPTERVLTTAYFPENQETEIIKLCSELNIPRIIPIESTYVDTKNRKIYQITPLCNHGPLHASQFKTSHELQCSLKELAETILSLHQHQIVHWDLKPDNILVKDRSLIVIDFDCSWKLNDPSYPQPRHPFGTICYLSPEPRNSKQSPYARDVFAFGSTVYEATTGRSLAEDIFQILSLENPSQIIGKNVEYVYITRANDALIQKAIEIHIKDDNLKDLLKKILSCDFGNNQWDHSKEFLMEEVLNHSYFSSTKRAL
jgi:hypothetical protein